MPRKEEVVTQALCASTMPSTGTSAEIPDYDNKPTLPARNSLILSSSSVVSKPGRITPRVCLTNDAGEDVATTTGYANTTKHDTTTATGTSVSMATASATTPVFQSEEEAPAASLPGPGCTEVVLPKKSVEEAQGYRYQKPSQGLCLQTSLRPKRL